GDIFSSVIAVIGTLLAVLHRRETGEGQYVDVSMADSLFALAELPFSKYTFEREGKAMAGAEPPVYYTTGVYGAGEGEFYLGVMTTGQFERLAKLLGHEEWIGDERFRDPAQRAAASREVLIPALQEWARARTKHEAAAALRSAGLAASPVNTPADILESPHFE